MIHNVIDRYCHNVSKELRKITGDCGALPIRLRNDLEDYLEENPGAVLDDVYENFGKPESYAKEYLATMNSAEIQKGLSFAKFRKKALLSFLAAILSVAVGLSVWIGARNSWSEVEYFEYYLEEGTTIPLEG